MTNIYLIIRFIKKLMPCKNCKKNATMVVDAVKDAISTPPKHKSDCANRREAEKAWLDSPEGKSLIDQVKLTSAQSIILWVGAYIPLFIGYVTIIRFIISLF